MSAGLRWTENEPLAPLVVDEPLATTLPLSLSFQPHVCPDLLLSISASTSIRPSSPFALSFQCVDPLHAPLLRTSPPPPDATAGEAARTAAGSVEALHARAAVRTIAGVANMGHSSVVGQVALTLPGHPVRPPLASSPSTSDRSDERACELERGEGGD